MNRKRLNNHDKIKNQNFVEQPKKQRYRLSGLNTIDNSMAEGAMKIDEGQTIEGVETASFMQQRRTSH